MPRGCVSLAFEKTWRGYADLSRTKPKSDYLAILPYSDEPAHVSEVVDIPPPLSPPLPPPPPPLTVHFEEMEHFIFTNAKLLMTEPRAYVCQSP